MSVFYGKPKGQSFFSVAHFLFSVSEIFESPVDGVLAHDTPMEEGRKWSTFAFLRFLKLIVLEMREHKLCLYFARCLPDSMYKKTDSRI